MKPIPHFLKILINQLCKKKTVAFKDLFQKQSSISFEEFKLEDWLDI